jgi:NADH-quinone oxidoreductase subunit K
MSELALLHHFEIIGAMLFGIGLIGFVARRNMIVMFLSAEMMLQGVSLGLVAWGRFHNDFGGQVLVLFIIAVAACEAAVALALILMLWRRSGSLDIAVWRELGEAGIEPYVAEEPPEEPAAPPDWPTLPPAGVRPEIDRDQTDYRDHV